MSKWTNISGVCRGKNTSARKIIESVLDGEDFVFQYDKDKFFGRFEREGFYAAKTCQEILDAAKTRDPNVIMDFCAEIEYC